MGDDVGESIVHLAGVEFRVGSQLRQRCGWCGAVLIDVDLAEIAFGPDPDGQPRQVDDLTGGYPVWPAGGMVEVWGDRGSFRGGAVVAVEHHEDGTVKMPANCCAQLPHDVTGHTGDHD